MNFLGKKNKMTEKDFEVISSLCYGNYPCLFKIPDSNFQSRKLFNYFSGKSSIYCKYKPKENYNLNLKKSGLNKRC